jgi:hypothetical protein
MLYFSMKEQCLPLVIHLLQLLMVEVVLKLLWGLKLLLVHVRRLH